MGINCVTRSVDDDVPHHIDHLNFLSPSLSLFHQASKSLVQEKDRLLTLRDQTIEKIQRENTKLKRKNKALAENLEKFKGGKVDAGATAVNGDSSSPASEADAEPETRSEATARRAASIKLGRDDNIGSKTKTRSTSTNKEAKPQQNQETS